MFIRVRGANVMGLICEVSSCVIMKLHWESVGLRLLWCRDGVLVWLVVVVVMVHRMPW